MVIERSKLADKLARIKSVIPGRNAISGIGGALVTGNKVIVSNHEICITAALPVKTDKPFILPLRAIDMIAYLPEGEMEICLLPGDRITIETAGIQNTFSCPSPDDFLMPEALDKALQRVQIDSGELCEMVSSVLYAASTAETRPVYMGALFEAKNGELNVVTVDGHRAAWNRRVFDGDFRFVAPRTTLDKLLRLGISGGIDISLGARNAIFMTEEYTVYSRLLIGEFMSYRRAFPSDYATSVTVDRRALLDSIGRILICIDDKQQVPLMMTFTRHSMILSVKSSVVDYYEEIGFVGTPDEDLKIGVNSYFLRDAVKSYNTESVTMLFGSASQPMLLTDGILKSMILPIRMAEHGYGSLDTNAGK